MKKQLALLLSASLTIMSLTGCGNSNVAQSSSAPAVSSETTSAQETEKKDSGETVEITYWDQNANEVRTEIFTHLIEEFEKENPDIKINFVPIPSSDAKSKYDVAIQSNTAPDCGGVSQYWIKISSVVTYKKLF